MIQCTLYKNYYAFKASNDNTHKTKQYTQIQLNLQLVIKDILHKTVLTFFLPYCFHTFTPAHHISPVHLTCKRFPSRSF